MRAIKPLAALLLGVLAAAAVFWRFGQREGAPPQDEGGKPSAAAQAASPAGRSRAAATRVARAPAAGSGIALAKQREIEAMSPTFRETSFLIAIRKAGFECADVIGADPAGDTHAAWRVTCREAAAYLVSVDAAGRLEIEPTPYGEGQPFNVIRQGTPPRRAPVPPLPRLPQP